MKERFELEHLEKYEPFPFVRSNSQQNNEKVFGQIYLDEISFWGKDDGGQIRISASLINEKMLNMEFDALEKEDTPLFFYEFIGDATFNSNIELKKYYFLRHWEENEFYSLRIIDTETIDDNFEMIKKEYESKVMFEGEITFSASPILSHKVVIVVEGLVRDQGEEEYKKLKQTYDNWDETIKKQCIYDKKEIIKNLNKLFNDKNEEIVCQSVDIYNVGQANCCYCDLGTRKIFFDIGITRSSKEIQSQLINSAVNEISNLDVDAVVLSHWDLDHILGVCYNAKCLYGKIWIVPDFEKLYSIPRLSIKRVCNFLLKNGKSTLLMIDTKKDPKEDPTDSTTVGKKLLFESSNKSLSLYMGTPVVANGINKMNNGGLIMRLQNKKNILLTGDCENSIIPQSAVNDKYDNILIPHHGSKMSNPRFNGKENKNNYAYISRGKISGNCNLDGEIKEKYENKGFLVKNTMNLHSNNKYRIKL